tara:strand:+ start:490 stop:858 length:369 start_codon:yes stop_codon:yes gene_type:complete
MAVTKTSTITALAGILVLDLDADATVEANITGNTSGTLYMVEIDNTANANTSAYLRVRDASSAATTDDHTWMFYAPAGQRVTYALNEGEAYSAGLCTWCTSNPAYQDATAPSSAVITKILAS